MRSLTATVRAAAAEQTLALPFRVPVGQQWFSLQQAASVIGIGESMVEKLYNQGRLKGHSHNAGSGQRDHKRITRVSLIAYLVSTADYTDESLGDELVACLTHLPPETLVRIAKQAQALAFQKSGGGQQ
jgi:hypothetical protein